MRTSLTTDRLLVVSDVHLGNRLFFRARQPFVEFLKFALAEQYNLCINGDGVDIMQTSISQISRDLAACASHLQQFQNSGLNVFYTVGNHDIVLEHFLDDWEILNVVPFLNVSSGGKRIHIEHGHLYDDMFVRSPGFYTAMTILGGQALRIHPRVYGWLEGTRDFFYKFRPAAKTPPGREASFIPGEAPSFSAAAERIADRGFDYVIFGHTHKHGQMIVGDGATYINAGGWMDPQYVEITKGQVTLKPVAGIGSQS